MYNGIQVTVCIWNTGSCRYNGMQVAACIMECRSLYVQRNMYVPWKEVAICIMQYSSIRADLKKLKIFPFFKYHVKYPLIVSKASNSTVLSSAHVQPMFTHAGVVFRSLTNKTPKTCLGK